MRRSIEAPSGFTLIEVLVVIVVLGVLASMVAPEVFKHVGGAKDAVARSQVELLSASLDAYRMDNDVYPSTDQGLESLRRQPLSDPAPTNWRGPYLRKEVPMDPWGRPYVYRSPGEANPWGFDLLSYGRDGKDGGEGEDADILSWK